MEDKKHPFLDFNQYHPILEDKKHPFLDVNQYHPILEDKKHSFVTLSAKTRIVRTSMHIEKKKKTKFENYL